jgi:hypothetical protein
MLNAVFKMVSLNNIAYKTFGVYIYVKIHRA